MLNSKLIDEIQTEFENWLENERREIASQLKTIPEHAQHNWLQERFEINDRRQPENQPLRLLIDFLFQLVQVKIKHLDSLRSGNLKFRRAFASVRGHSEKEKLILNYAGELGARPRQLGLDAKAFARWFDEEAVLDRYAKRVGQVELMLTFVFSRLTEVIGQVFNLAYKYHFQAASDDDVANQKSLHQRLAGIWKRLNMEARIHDALICDCDHRVHVSVLKCLAAAIGKLPDDLGAELLDHRAMVFIHRVAMDTGSDVWMQCEALSILSSLCFPQALPFLRHRLEHPQDGDDIFVRRHALKLIEQYLLKCLKRVSGRSFVVTPHDSEPSPFVRQKMAKVAFLSTHADAKAQWRSLVFHDPVPQVRAAALLAGIETSTDFGMAMDYLEAIEQCLNNETDSFVLRTAFYCLIQLLDKTADLPANSIRRQKHGERIESAATSSQGNFPNRGRHQRCQRQTTPFGKSTGDSYLLLPANHAPADSPSIDAHSNDSAAMGRTNP